MKVNQLFSACAGLGLCAGAGLAAPVQIPVDDLQSDLTLTLCIQGVCTNDTAPAGGFVTLGILDVSNITTATLENFEFSMSRPAVLNIDFGFFGRFFSTVSNFTVYDAAPGTPKPPAVVTGSEFRYAPVTTLSDGLVSYDSTGAVCANLTNLMLPCVGVIDLATRPPVVNTGAAPCSGAPLILNVTSVGRTVTFTGQVCSQGLLDPAQPSIGSLTVTGTITGSITLPPPPCPADLNGDRAVNVIDLTVFLGLFGQSLTPGNPGDLNADGSVNTSDLILFLTAFGVPCPA